MISSVYVELYVEAIFKILEQEETHKYLGMSEDSDIQLPIIKEKISIECYRKKVLKSEVYAHDMLNINFLVVPVMTYSFSLFNCNTQNDEVN